MYKKLSISFEVTNDEEANSTLIETADIIKQRLDVV